MTDALELDALWEDFHRAVNMTSQELAAWLRVSDATDTIEPLPDKAGTPTGQHVLAILQKRRTDLTDADIRVMYQVVDTVEAQKNYMDYGIQLGRRFRALKAWVIFRSFGREGMATRLREFVRLTNLFADWIKSDSRFELVAPVSMSVVCFRFVAGDERKIDKLNSQIVETINESGRAYLTQTKLRDRTVMRIGLGNVLTTEEHLRRAWEMIRETANELNREK